MTIQVLANLAAAGESTEGNVVFNIHPHMFRYNANPSVALQGMITAETATFFLADGAGWTPVFDTQATPAAAILDFDNNKFTVTFNSPGLYSVTHTALGAIRKLIATY